jgi:hypothetical protein
MIHTSHSSSIDSFARSFKYNLDAILLQLRTLRSISSYLRSFMTSRTFHTHHWTIALIIATYSFHSTFHTTCMRYSTSHPLRPYTSTCMSRLTLVLEPGTGDAGEGIAEGRSALVPCGLAHDGSIQQE